MPVRLLAGLAVAVGVLLVIAANIHLVTVAIESQPGCVEHERLASGGHAYSAANSAC